MINLLHCINGVRCSHPENSSVSSTRHVFGSSGLRSGHADIILQSCFTRGRHRCWNPAMKICKWTKKLHVVPVYKHHASEKKVYPHLRASLVCRSAWTPCALGPWQRHFYGSSPRKHRSKQKYRYESNFLSADWHALPHLGHRLGINSGGELADSGHAGICVIVQLFENPGRKVILWDISSLWNFHSLALKKDTAVHHNIGHCWME